MAKFRLISKSGDALALALRIADESHTIDFWIKDPKAKASYTGILPQVKDWRQGLKKDTIIILDMVGLGPIANNLKKAGFKIYGGGVINDRMELDREFGIELAKASGVKVPEYQKFKSFEKAISFCLKSDKVWVFKPQGNKSTAWTYVSSDKEDMAEMLEYFKGIWRGKIEFLLQEKIDGVEFSTECFYVDGEPVTGTLNSTLECKKFLDGDKGPNTGCMGSVVRFWKNPKPKIYRLGLKKIESLLRRFKYSGPLDCNCIVSEKDKLPYFLEWTARFGYSALYALCEDLGIGAGDFIASLASSHPTASGAFLRPSYEWLTSARISIPPYPNEANVRQSKGIPVRGIDSLEHVWLLDVKFENSRLLSAGVDGVICEVTGKAKTLDELDKQIYRRIAKLRIPDMQYRSDIVKVAKERIGKLKDWKYL